MGALWAAEHTLQVARVAIPTETVVGGMQHDRGHESRCCTVGSKGKAMVKGRRKRQREEAR